ncbi:MAG: tol-pal system protein YbgF [Pseudomonadota bacterium]
MRRVVTMLVAAMLVASAAAAQDRAQSLADIRQELTVLSVEIQRLRAELSTTGAPSVAAGGGSVLDRITAIESELQRLTGKTEELEFRIGRIVSDGTNRIGDLEFRLVELEGGDISQLGETSTLGGDSAAPAPAAPVAPPTDAPQLAQQERVDFEQAQEALAAGDLTTAARLFATFNQTYPGGPLAPAADLARGEALSGLGDTREAARAYLAAFSADQTGPTAPEALFRLGRALGRLGQTNEACVTLGEVPVRFPVSEAASLAADERTRLGCA